MGLRRCALSCLKYVHQFIPNTHQDWPHTSCHTFARGDNAKVLEGKKKYGVANANPVTSELRQNTASFWEWNQSSYISALYNWETRPYILGQINICRLVTWAADTWTTLSDRIKHLILWQSFISPHDAWHHVCNVGGGAYPHHVWARHSRTAAAFAERALSFVESRLLPSAASLGTKPSLYSRSSSARWVQMPSMCCRRTV